MAVLIVFLVKEKKEIKMANKDQLAVCYAALILHDSGAPVTAEKMNAVIAAAKITVAPVYAALYEGFLKKNSIKSLIAGGGSAPAAGGAAAAAAPAAGAAAAKPDPKAASKKAAPAPAPEEDDDMGLGLFD